MSDLVRMLVEAWPFAVVAFVIATVIGAERQLPFVQTQVRTRRGFFFATLPVQPLVLGAVAGLFPLPVHPALCTVFGAGTPPVVMRVLYYLMAGALSGQVYAALNRLVKAYLQPRAADTKWPTRPRGHR